MSNLTLALDHYKSKRTCRQCLNRAHITTFDICLDCLLRKQVSKGLNKCIMCKQVKLALVGPFGNLCHTCYQRQMEILAKRKKNKKGR